MTDLPGRILAAIELAAQDARNATIDHRRGPEWAIAEARQVPWGVESDPVEILAGGKPIIQFSNEYGGGLAAPHVKRQDPQTTLRRCEADKRTVERHAPVVGILNVGQCNYCAESWPCPDLLDRADAYDVTRDGETT